MLFLCVRQQGALSAWLSFIHTNGESLTQDAECHSFDGRLVAARRQRVDGGAAEFLVVMVGRGSEGHRGLQGY